jgi:hypothetical protein
MRAMWKFLLPYCANGLDGLEYRVDAVIEEIAIIGKDFDFEDVDSPNVRICLDSNSQPLTDTDLTELKKKRTYDEKEEIASEGDGYVSRKF